MQVKIAVFGREDSIAKFNHLADKQNDVEVVSFTYEKEEETVELIEKAFMCDVYIFTEAISFLYVKQKVEKKRLPTIQIPHDEHMVLTNLYQLKNSVGQNVKRLSVDIDNKDVVHRVIDELKLNSQDIYIYDYGLDLQPSIEKIVNHHAGLWQDGKIDYVLTSVKSVERQLKERNIPVNSMIIPDINSEEAIKQAKSTVRLDLSKSAQIVTGYIQIKEPDKTRNEYGEQGLKDIMSKLSDILTKFSKKTDISIFPVSDYKIVLIGTKALINHLTNHYRDFPLLREIQSEVNVPIDFGYGLGLTAKQSNINAEIALEICNKTDESKCYIVNERQETIGPIGVKKEFDASKLYHALIHKARLNNELSYNFIDFIRIRNNEPFSSNDVAKYYNVTKRSAERTVNKLLNGDVIKVSGEERPYQKGRPRKLFTLNQ
ncbi:hypothetical protein [Oceanobacillus salinisoli]|uniref:hypothetical protein n=1 Tax=Oceanobacillus salinisoli TaxID=2678611 RepID=UPI0012E143FA|nr:hypothetical protein [Oceanobacillus salinisoli]